jgi:hypothetical protein
MLPEDALEFLAYARTKAPTTCTERYSDSGLISERDVRSGSQLLCLWNHDILPTLRREYITNSAKPYYRVDTSLPVIEFSVPHKSEWNGVPALTQGRIWASFDVPSEPLRRWFDSLVRRIRKTFVKNPIHWQSGYVGQYAYEWHRRGGLLLPTYSPPITVEWEERLHSQHAEPQDGCVDGGWR